MIEDLRITSLKFIPLILNLYKYRLDVYDKTIKTDRS